METLLIGIAMAILGHLTHLLKKVTELRVSGDKTTLIQYVKARPYITALGVCGSAAAMGWMIENNQVTAMTAFGVGFMADSALGIVTAGTKRHVQ